MFSREKALCLACDSQCAFYVPINYNLWSCRKVYGALVCLSDNIFIRFGTRLCRQIVGIPMCAGCAPLVAGLFLFCYERDFVGSVSPENQADIIEAFNITSSYLDGFLGVDNVCFGKVVGQICPTGLLFGRANSSGVGAPFLDLNSSFSDSAKIYDKRDDFGFGVVDFPFLGGGVPLNASCGICISRFISFAGAASNVIDFSCRNKALTAKLLGQGHRYLKLRKAFSEFYRRHGGLVEECGVSLGKHLR